MSEKFTFNALAREKVGKGASREARRNGLVPATIYGNSKSPVSVCLDPKEVLSQTLKTTVYSNTYTVKLNSKAEEVLVRKIQLHPVSDKPLHVDLLRVGEKTVIRLEIPVVFHNHIKCPGLKLGGTLNVVVHNLEVACNPKNAPKQIDIDLSETKIGDVIKVEDIKLPEGSKTYYPKGFPIASITAKVEEGEKKAQS